MKFIPQTFFCDGIATSIKYHGNIWKKSWKLEKFEVRLQAYDLILWVIAVELVWAFLQLEDDEKSG